MLERQFHLTRLGTTVRTELLAGVTTFLTMAYIVFVQPTVLSAAGMDHGAVLTATCLASAIGTLLMAFLANYPIAVAPAMGHNFFFAFTVVVAGGTPWPVALGAVAIAGGVFILTAGFGLRERVIAAVPTPLQHAIGVGIGLLIALIGFEWAGIIVDAPGTLVTLGRLGSPPALLAVGTLALTAVLMARKVRGAFLIGMIAATVAALGTGLVQFGGVVALPPSLAPTFLKLDVLGALQPKYFDVVLVFFLLALFDSIGTLVGVMGSYPFSTVSAPSVPGVSGAVAQPTPGTGRTETVEKGYDPLSRALLADAVGTVAGAALGTSTVTAYVESSAGVAAGGRTGLAAVVTAALFLAALFCYPLVRMIGGGYTAPDGAVLYPIVAPTLILVGVLMMSGVRHIQWEDPVEAIPSFLTILTMPLAVSITDGIAFGFIATALLHVTSGRPRALAGLTYAFAIVFLLRYAFALR
jgi:AGZA family xanthine/uracil permease-like MFS transporter